MAFRAMALSGKRPNYPSRGMSGAVGIPSVWDYLEIFQRRWWLPTLGLAVGIAVAVVLGGRSDPLVEARAQVLIQVHTIDAASDDRRDEGRVVATSSELAGSDLVSVLTADQLGLPVAPDVMAAPIAGTDIVELAVRDHDPDLAVAAANAYADSLASATRETLGAEALVVTRASHPTSDLTESTRRSAAMLGFVGLVAGLGAALAAELRARRPGDGRPGADGTAAP